MAPRIVHLNSPSTLNLATNLSQDSSDELARLFVYEPEADCSEYWAAWPAVQDRGVAHGTIIVLDIFASVGNVFYVLRALMRVSLRACQANFTPDVLPSLGTAGASPTSDTCIAFSSTRARCSDFGQSCCNYFVVLNGLECPYWFLCPR